MEAEGSGRGSGRGGVTYAAAGESGGTCVGRRLRLRLDLGRAACVSILVGREDGASNRSRVFCVSASPRAS